MFSISNNSEDLIILLHEIYGINPFIKSVANKLAAFGYDVICPELCGSAHTYDYEEQSAAFCQFLEKQASKKLPALL